MRLREAILGTSLLLGGCDETPNETQRPSRMDCLDAQNGRYAVKQALAQNARAITSATTSVNDSNITRVIEGMNRHRNGDQLMTIYIRQTRTDIAADSPTLESDLLRDSIRRELAAPMYEIVRAIADMEADVLIPRLRAANSTLATCPRDEE